MQHDFLGLRIQAVDLLKLKINTRRNHQTIVLQGLALAGCYCAFNGIDERDFVLHHLHAPPRKRVVAARDLVDLATTTDD